MSQSFILGNAGTASSGTFVGSYSGEQYVVENFPGAYPSGNVNADGNHVVNIESVALQGAISAGHGYNVQFQGNNNLVIYYNTDGGNGSLNFTRYLNNGGSISSSTGDTWSGGGLWATVNWSTVPGAPSSFSATRTGRSVRLSLGATPDDGGAGVSSYWVQYSTGGGAYGTTGDITSGSFTYNSLTPGATYSFRGFANNGNGSGAPRTVSVTIPVLPTAPALSTARNGTAVTLNLGTSTSTDPVTYFAQMSTDGGSTWQTAQTVTGSTYTYSGLTPGATYFFRVYAASDIGNSPFTTSAGVTVATVPTAPSSITTVRSGRNVTVSLGLPSSTGGDSITGLYVQTSFDGGSTWDSPTQSSGSGGGSVTYTGLSTGKTYIFRAYATNDIGNSPYATSAGVFISGYGKRYWQANVTNVTATGGVITYTAANHGFSVGDSVAITGVNPTTFNVSGTVASVISSSQFTVANANGGTYVSGGLVAGFALVTSGYRWSGSAWVPITTSQKVASGTTYSNFN